MPDELMSMYAKIGPIVRFEQAHRYPMRVRPEPSGAVEIAFLLGWALLTSRSLDAMPGISSAQFWWSESRFRYQVGPSMSSRDSE
jgi:hypothetical protein